MAKKRYARTPLLYIQQPTIRKPEATMQHEYNTPKKRKSEATSDNNKEKTVPKRVPRQVRPVKSKEPVTEKSIQLETKKEGKNEQDVLEEEPEEKDSVKFKDMSLQQKIEYFAETPKHLPKMRCEIRTDERRYKGIVTRFEENIVYMRVGRRSSNTKIPFESVIDVRMLGF